MATDFDADSKNVTYFDILCFVGLLRAVNHYNIRILMKCLLYLASYIFEISIKICIRFIILVAISLLISLLHAVRPKMQVTSCCFYVDRVRVRA